MGLGQKGSRNARKHIESWVVGMLFVMKMVGFCHSWGTWILLGMCRMLVNQSKHPRILAPNLRRNPLGWHQSSSVNITSREGRYWKRCKSFCSWLRPCHSFWASISLSSKFRIGKAGRLGHEWRWVGEDLALIALAVPCCSVFWPLCQQNLFFAGGSEMSFGLFGLGGYPIGKFGYVDGRTLKLETSCRLSTVKLPS